MGCTSASPRLVLEPSTLLDLVVEGKTPDDSEGSDVTSDDALTTSASTSGVSEEVVL